MEESQIRRTFIEEKSETFLVATRHKSRFASRQWNKTKQRRTGYKQKCDDKKLNRWVLLHGFILESEYENFRKLNEYIAFHRSEPVVDCLNFVRVPLTWIFSWKRCSEGSEFVINLCKYYENGEINMLNYANFGAFTWQNAAIWFGVQFWPQTLICCSQTFGAIKTLKI